MSRTDLASVPPLCRTDTDGDASDDDVSPSLSRHPRLFFSHAVETETEVDLINAEGGMPVDFRPVARLTPRFTLEGVQTRSISLWQTTSRSGFLTVPKVHADVISIRFITAGAMMRRDHRGEHIGGAGHAMMVMFDAMRSAEASDAFVSVSGTVTRDALAAAHVSLEGAEQGSLLPHFVPIVDATGQPLQSLKRTMDQVFEQLKRGVQTTDLVFPLLEEVMVYRLLTAWPRLGAGEPPRTRPTHARPLKRAKDYIDGHIAGKLLLADIASAAGVGVRRLQLAFKTETGKTPVQYILERRLDRVRADLRASRTDRSSISTIATRWGFTHMSDFSRRYRERFGEAPSATQRR